MAEGEIQRQRDRRFKNGNLFKLFVLLESCSRSGTHVSIRMEIYAKKCPELLGMIPRNMRLFRFK